MIRRLPLLLVLGLAAGAAARDRAETEILVLEALARQDWAEAQTLWQPLAEAGEPEAEYQLGLLFATAPTPYRSRAGARAFLSRAADRGHREANYRLGLLLAGEDPPEEAEALARFKTAAAGGHVLAASEVARREGKSPSFRFALPDPNAPRPPDSWSPQVVTRAPEPGPPPGPSRPEAVVLSFPIPPPRPPTPAVTVDPDALAEAAPTVKPAPPPPQIDRPRAPKPTPATAALPPALAQAAVTPPGALRIRLAVLREPSSLAPFEREFRRKTNGWRDGLTLTPETDPQGWTRLYLGHPLSAAEAHSLCRALQERRVDCVVVR